MSGPNTNYTLVVTACQRNDLLEQTLNSFFEVNSVAPREVIVVEDSADPMPEFLHDSIWKQRSLKWISNGARLGQVYSIDRAYRMVTTDFIFHCEEDWLFLKDPHINQAKEILNTYPEISMVSLRGHAWNHPLINYNRVVNDLRFKIAEPYWLGTWGGICFNCGVRRKKDWTALSSYGAHVSYGTTGLSHEASLSKIYLDQGFRIADTGEEIVRHLGDGRSRSVEKLPPLPKILIAVLSCHEFSYTKWKMQDDPDKTGFHQDGPNAQTQAVRETWALDAGAFPTVDVRFFYGHAPNPPSAKDDEVYLDCPDDYAGLPQKTIAICKWALANGYDYAFKCDTDSIVYVDRLVMELMTQRPFEYAGFKHCNVCSGGPGYWLSNRAMKVVADGPFPTHYAEDVHVCHTLNANGIEAKNLEHHRSGYSAHFYFNDGFDPNKLDGEIISAHAVFPDDMRKWYRFTRQGTL